MLLVIVWSFSVQREKIFSILEKQWWNKSCGYDQNKDSNNKHQSNQLLNMAFELPQLDSELRTELEVIIQNKTFDESKSQLQWNDGILPETYNAIK